MYSVPPYSCKRAHRRSNEAKKAGALAGIKEVIYGGFDDLEIFSDNKESVDKVVKIIRYVNPDFIITHNPDDYILYRRWVQRVPPCSHPKGWAPS